jgi:ribosomal protein S18 acetylase RimI-like enzyme
VRREVVGRLSRLPRSIRSAVSRGPAGNHLAWTVFALGEDDWRLLRRARLRSLHDSGGHLGGDLRVERHFSRSDWRSRAENETWLAVRHPNRLLRLYGLVGIVMLNHAGDCDRLPTAHPHIEGIWVARWCRGQGVANALATTIIDSADGPVLGLWVFEGNHLARDLFGRLGFEADGGLQLYQDGRRKEQHMSMEIQRPRDGDRGRQAAVGRSRTGDDIPGPRPSASVSATGR